LRFLHYKKDILAFLAGSLLLLAFAPFELPLIAFVSIISLLWLLLDISPLKAARTGYFFGLGYFGFGVYWVYYSIHHFGHAPLWLSIIIMLGMVAILASYIALISYLLNRFFTQYKAVRYLIAFPALWLAGEYFRSMLFTGFPWLSLGFSQIDTLLAAWAPVVGVYGVSWLTVLVAACVFLGFQSSSWLGRTSAFIVFLSCWLGAWQLNDVEWSQPRGKAISVALLQGNIPQEIKWSRDFRQPTLDAYRQMNADSAEVDLVVWPETAIPAFYHEVEKDYLAGIQKEAIASDTDVVLGIPVLGHQAGQYYNGLLSIRQMGQFYRKHHLVPLGEYMPLKPFSTFILAFLNIPLSDFSAGDAQQPLLTAAGYPFASSICYEDVFQQTSLVGLPEAAYLVNVSNDTWFGDTIAPFQHLEMARMRALESGRYMLRSTNTGITAIIDHKGRINKQAPMFKRHSLIGEIIPMQGATPFVQGAGQIMPAFLTVLLLLCISFRDKPAKD